MPRPTRSPHTTSRLRGYHPLWPAFPDRSAYWLKANGLIRFRSPLLAESLLMSFPPGTEMFQFPGFASGPYAFRTGYPLRGGFPHSDIRGSSIARISPRLIAACHVLHRLLAPRHPPNALIALNHHHHPHAGPKPTRTPSQRHAQASSAWNDSSCQNSAQPHSLTHITNQSRFTCQTTRHDPHPRQGAPRPAANSVMQRSPAPGPARERDTSKTLETVGIEPTTPCLQSRCSPTELRPHTPLHGHEGSS